MHRLHINKRDTRFKILYLYRNETSGRVNDPSRWMLYLSKSRQIFFDSTEELSFQQLNG